MIRPNLIHSRESPPKARWGSMSPAVAGGRWRSPAGGVWSLAIPGGRAPQPPLAGGPVGGRHGPAATAAMRALQLSPARPWRPPASVVRGAPQGCALACIGARQVYAGVWSLTALFGTTCAANLDFHQSRYTCFVLRQRVRSTLMHCHFSHDREYV